MPNSVSKRCSSLFAYSNTTALARIADAFSGVASRLESLVDDGDDSTSKGDPNDPLLLAICDALQSLCEKRVQCIGRDGNNLDDWVEILDASLTPRSAFLS